MRRSLIHGTKWPSLTFVCLTVPESLRVIRAAWIYRASFRTDNVLHLSEIHPHTTRNAGVEGVLKISRGSATRRP